MADIELSVGGRIYALSCRDGEEEHLRKLGRVVSAKADAAKAVAPGLTEVRQLLFAALFLADELNDSGHSTAQPAVLADESTIRIIEALADRMESLAERLAPPLATT